VDSLLPLAKRVLTDPAGLWKDAHGEARVALQRFLFPEGVPFDGDSFGTAVTSPLFSRLRAWERAKGKMVSHEVPSWNQVCAWLRDLGGLRAAMGRETEDRADAS